MAVQTAEQVKQYFILQDKSELELRAICEGMKLKTHGTKQELINRLLALDFTPQKSVLVPMAIPFRTRDVNSQPLQAAAETMRKWRKAIFDGTTNQKEFELANNKGKTYKMQLKYLQCGTKTLKHILDHQWLLHTEAHSDLIRMLKEHPEQFTTSIIRKPDSRGNTWIMLHVAPKKAA